MKKREIILVIVVIAFGVIYNAVKSGDFDFYSGCSYGSRSLLDRKHPKDFPQKEIIYKKSDKDVFTADKIKINNPAGDIEVEKSPDGTIRIVPVVRVYHRNKKKAGDISRDIRLVTREIGEKLTIDVDSNGRFPYRRVRIGFKCFLPEDVELDLKNRYGDIAVKDAGKNITINERHGNLFVKNIDSQLKVKSDHGRVRLYDIKGHIQLDSDHSKIKIRNVPSLKLKCSHATLYINEVEGETDITYAGFCDLEIEKSGKLNIDARHTKMRLASITGGVTTTNSHAPMYMKDIEGDINIKAKHCRIDLSHAAGDTLIVKDSYSYVDLEDVSAKSVDVRLDHGDLKLVFNNIEERVNIKTRHADVALKYPESLKPAFNITSYNGRIVNRTAADLKVLQDREKRSLNTLEGKPQIIIDTGYGDVTLKNSKTLPAEAVKPLPAEKPETPPAEDSKEKESKEG
jgi:DUF4097 and DUF4098 domain-containing protein YvlB